MRSKHIKRTVILSGSLWGFINGMRKPPSRHLRILTKEEKTHRNARILIVFGVLFLIVAGGYQAYLYFDSYLAGRRAQRVIEQSEVNIVLPTNTPIPTDDIATNSLELYASKDMDPKPIVSITPSPTPIPERAPDDTIGILSIQKINIKLPVFFGNSDELLKTSVCRYMGDALYHPERLVIAGHNYMSHFGKLRRMAIGDIVSFTSTDGIDYLYTVSEITEIPMDSQIPLFDGEWDLALFTCSGSNRSIRVLVRCLALE